MTDDEQLAANLAAELATHPPVEVHLTATGALHLVGLLQLVLRHPMIAQSSRATAIAVIEQLRVYFVDAPATLAVIRRGDDPGQDRPAPGPAPRRPS
jgi:hypothetical protein